MHVPPNSGSAQDATATKKDNRKVSEGISQDFDEAIDLVSSAEAYIERKLEDSDDFARAGIDNAQQSILGFVPENVDPTTFGNLADTDIRSSVNRSRRFSERRSKCVAESLFELTADLSTLDKKHGDGDQDLLNERDTGADMLLTHHDKLVKNATTLVRRNNIVPKGFTDSNSDSSDEPLYGNSDRKWKGKASRLEDSDVDASQRSQLQRRSVPTSKSAARLGSPARMRAGKRLQKLKLRYKDMEQWLSFRKQSTCTYAKYMLLGLLMPSAGIAAILFYFGGNPPCGTTDECNNSTALLSNVTSDTDMEEVKLFFDEASASWWILFLGCRQPLTLTLAFATQAFIIEFLALRTKWAVNLFGPFVTLFLVQSNGWPFILFWWAVYDFSLLYGSSRWVRHWLYWQVRREVHSMVSAYLCITCFLSTIVAPCGSL